MSGITLARPLQLDDKPVTRVENFCATGSEALRQAAYAVASGAYDVAMAIGVEKTKDSGYQGLNAVPAAERRHRAHAHRGRDVLDGRARVRDEVRRRRRQAARGDGARRVEEPPQRRPQPARRSSGARCRWRRSASRRRWPATSACSTARASPTAPRPRSCAGRGRPRVHRQADLREGAVVRRRQRRRRSPTRRTTTRTSRRSRRPRATRTRRPASPTRAASSRWPRCTTASPSPSWC